MQYPMDVGAFVKDFLDREQISQQELATRANVSQSTVSRALRRPAVRGGAARSRLVAFMQQQGPRTARPESALHALEEIWDGSEAHAAALASLVRASVELWPRLGER
jgi:transcriptional regulator with XRE-family HTH domain